MSWKKEVRDFLDLFFNIGNPGNYIGGLGLVGPSESGVDVNEATSMTVGAVAACQRIISSAVASMGCYVYRETEGDGRVRATDHPLYNLLALSPNPDYPAVDFFSAGQVNLLQNGNGYAEIIRDNGDNPVQILLRSPFRTWPFRDPQTGEITYKTSDTISSRERVVAARDMIHVKNMGVDPYLGLSPIRLYMREIIGTALAAQAYGARLFKNDARPGGYLSSATPQQPAKKLEQIQSWVQGHRAGNNHMPAYLDGGVEWKTVGIAPDEAQFLQTRQFQRSEIASIYGVPAHMLGDPQETKATIEQKALEFLLWTVKIWLRRWEHSINVKLFPAPDPRKSGPKTTRYYAKFDTSEFERADYSTMLKGLQTGRYAGLITVNEGRHALGYNPVTAENFGMSPDEFKKDQPGMSLWRPVNMAVAGEDPALYSSGGAGAKTGPEDEPVGDDSEPQGDSARSGALGMWFHEGLNQISALNKPDTANWRKVFRPIFRALAEEQTQEIDIISDLVIERMARQGVAAAHEGANTIMDEFTAAVRAAKAHMEGDICE